MTAIAILERQACGENGCPCRRAARNGKGLTHCIVHQDPNPSMKVDETSEGRVLVHCNASCEQRAVIAALRDASLWDEEPTRDISPVPFRRDPARSTSGVEPIAVYRYATHEGEALEKARFEQGEHKWFRWRKAGDTGWLGLDGLKASEIALWGADLVAKAAPDAPVWVCEGEKATEACRARGLLAVTFCGGAGAKDFGKAFECLKGHPVYLWPDNDPSGRAYASLVKAHLESMGVRVRPIAVAVPEKGDAHDYFAAGGQVEDLLQKVPTQDILQFLSEDALRVRMHNTVLGLVEITCSEITKTNKSLDAQVTVQVLSPHEHDPVSDRCDLQSLWKMGNLRSTLDTLHKIGSDGSGWTKILLKAFGMIRDGYLNHDPSTDAADIEAPEEQEFHVDVLAEAQTPTIFFGDGSAGKSFLTAGLALSAAAGEQFLGFECIRGPWLYVDYEANHKTFGRRLRRLARGYGMDSTPHGLVHYWPAKNVPLADLVPALLAKIRRDGIVGIIVDSAAPACGGDPLDTPAVTRLFGGLARLGLTSIIVAHITKSGDVAATMKPYGVVFWHNLARRTWFVERAQREGADIVDIGLFNRKVNDGRQPHPLGLSLRFDGENGPVTIERSDIRDVPEFDSKRPLLDRLREALASGANPIYTLAEKTGADADAIRKCLQRYEGKHFVRINDSRGGPGNKTYWGLREEEGEDTNRVSAIPF